MFWFVFLKIYFFIRNWSQITTDLDLVVLFWGWPHQKKPKASSFQIRSG